MSRFHGAWLRLREPLDAVSRTRNLIETLEQVMPERPIRVTDLATGTAANLRYLSPRLSGAQTWCLIDHDQALLDTIPARLAEWARDHGAEIRDTGKELLIDGPNLQCQVRWVRADLAAGLEAIDLPPKSLLSAAALLDLVSDPWLQALAQRCLSARATVLFALTYDGRMGFEPRDPQDETVINLVNSHQLRDKGFGPALGPTAGSRTIEAFERLGYVIESARSDWRIGPQDVALQEALLEGWLTAAVEIAPEQSLALEGWSERRRTHVARGRSTLTVGHVDILGYLPD